MQMMQAHIRGITGHIQHNGQTANPLNAWALEIKTISAKRNKTPEDYRRLADTEFLASLYTEPRLKPGRIPANAKVIVPSHVIEACWRDGAKKNKNGKLFSASVSILADVPLTYKGCPKTIAALLRDEAHRLETRVRVKGSRIMRCRPIFPDWELVIPFIYEPGILSQADIEQAIRDAGMYIGLSEWRPKHGRYDLLKLEEKK